MEKYKLIFSGQVKQDKQKDVLGKFLCKFLNISESNIEKLFSGRSFALRSNLSQQHVYDLQVKLEQAGILTRVIKEQQLEEEVTFQDTTQRNPNGLENVISNDYKMRVGDRTICRHCGSHLHDMPFQPLSVSVPPPVIVPEVLPLQISSVGDSNLQTTNAMENTDASMAQKLMHTQEAKTDIQQMDISDTWKQRFAILEKGGANRLSLGKFFFGEGSKLLTPKEYRSIQFPFGILAVAFIAGIFNYLFRGLVRKGLFIGSSLLFTFALIEFIAGQLGFQLSPIIIQATSGVLFTQLCCYDVYKLKVCKESFWPELPAVLGNPFVLSIIFFLSLGLYGATKYANL